MFKVRHVQNYNYILALVSQYSFDLNNLSRKSGYHEIIGQSEFPIIQLHFPIKADKLPVKASTILQK